MMRCEKDYDFKTIQYSYYSILTTFMISQVYLKLNVVQFKCYHPNVILKFETCPKNKNTELYKEIIFFYSDKISQN